MLNIPESIKALYKADGIRKNFRVTFPNGELPDITNDQIVTESVRFTESIMSQNTFRFGLAEAPQISFETVGVANMMGMTIRCWSEIETTSLPAEDIATIEAGEWDGEYVALEDSDLGYAFFRIPLGEFTVDSCPRSHGAMAHRQVKATGRTIGTNQQALDAFTYWKISQRYTSSTWNIDWNFLAPSVYGDTWDKAGKYFDVGEEFEPDGGYGSLAHSFNIEFTAGNVTSVVATGVNAHRRIYNKSGIYPTPTTTLVRIVRGPGYSYAAVYAALRSVVADLFDQIASTGAGSPDWEHSRGVIVDTASGGTTRVDLNTLDSCIDFATKRLLINDHLWFNPEIVIGGNSYHLPGDYSSHDAVLDLTAPNSASNWIIYVPYAIEALTVSAYVGSTPYRVTQGGETTIDGATIAAYPLTLKSEYAVDFPTLKLPTTLKTKVSGVTYYGYFNSFSFKKLMNGFLETNGMFGRINREGTLDLYTLTDTSAETISQSDLSELWWDESDVEPVGSVKVKFKASNAENAEDQEAVIELGDGESVYDMTDNYMLTKWATSLEDVTTLLQGKFLTNSAILTWTPTDANIRGLPYLEAGDWITCDTGAEDITEVGFPMLDRTMSGIQSLSDDISAVSGEVTAVEVDEDE